MSQARTVGRPSRRVVGVFEALLGLAASTGFGQDVLFVGCKTVHAVLVDLGQDAIDGFGVGVTLLARAAGVASVLIRSLWRPSQYRCKMPGGITLFLSGLTFPCLSPLAMPTRP